MNTLADSKSIGSTVVNLWRLIAGATESIIITLLTQAKFILHEFDSALFPVLRLIAPLYFLLHFSGIRMAGLFRMGDMGERAYLYSSGPITVARSGISEKIAAYEQLSEVV